ncbi:hypothetical protein M569_09570, partial [Genlisea aurea]
NGASWADQWDPDPTPSETTTSKKKTKHGRSYSDKTTWKEKMIGLSWIKNIAKKSTK